MLATCAVRRTPSGERELNYIIWQQPVPLGGIGEEQFFFVKELDGAEPVPRVAIEPPRPTNGFVTYPTGLAWDPTSDTFVYLERNSSTFLRIAADGTELQRWPHPAPPFQNFVFNLGVAIAPQRGTLCA